MQADRQIHTKQQKTPSGKADAITVLKDDHEAVSQLFKQYQAKANAKELEQDALHALASKICKALTNHATIEEEIFYPAALRERDLKSMIEEAKIEHESLKRLIADIKKCDGTDGRFMALVTVLREYVEHHVREEENELFPAARKSDLDLGKLGEDLIRRKSELSGKD